MKAYETPNLRNVAVAGHGSAGKTTLVEAALWLQKQTDRLVTVEDGNTVSDYDPEEIRRGHSINASLCPIPLKTTKINFLDLPGRNDFVGEIRNCMRAADAVVLVLDATNGVEVGAEFAQDYASEFQVKARAIFVNKMDKERADFEAAVAEVRDVLGARPVVVTLPVGKEADFSGVIDILKMKYAQQSDRKVTYGDIPAEMQDAADAARAELIETAAEGDDSLTEKFLEDQPLTEDEILQGLKAGIQAGDVVPVLCGSATQARGVDPLFSLIEQCFPNPLEGPGLEAQDGDGTKWAPVKTDGNPLAFVFKTVSDPYAGHLSFFKVIEGTIKSESQITNVNKGKHERIAHVLSICGKNHENVESLAAGDLGALAKLESTHTYDTLAGNGAGVQFTPTPMPKPTVRMEIVAKSKADEEKIGVGLHRLIEQDPTLTRVRDGETHQTLLLGMGDTHLDVAVRHLKETANVEAELNIPKVAYRETITKSAQGQGKYKKQSGGRGQYGDCHIKLEPLPEGGGFEFEWAIVGGVIPTKFEPAVMKGLEEALDKGRALGQQDGRHQGHVLRRIIPCRGLLGNGVQGRGLDGVQKPRAAGEPHPPGAHLQGEDHRAGAIPWATSWAT